MTTIEVHAEQRETEDGAVADEHFDLPCKDGAGSIAVYGVALYRQLYGELVPVTAERVVGVEGGQRLVNAEETKDGGAGGGSGGVCGPAPIGTAHPATG